jgi:hypothetical protein
METLRWPTALTVLATAILLAAGGCERHDASPPAAAPAAGAAQAAPSKAADVTAARLASADPDQWFTPGRDAEGTY